MYNKVLALLQEEYPEVDFTSSDELVDEGILDSLTLTGIIAALSMEFDIESPYDEIIEENFNSVEAMAEMVERQQLLRIWKNMHTSCRENRQFVIRKGS